MQKLINSIKVEYLEKFSFIALLFYAISPVIEYIFKNYSYSNYTHYFSFILYPLGVLGIVAYIIYFIKIKKKLNIKDFIPEILIIILLVISLISSILSKDVSLSFLGESYRKEGLIVYIMYIGILLLSSIIKDTKYIKYVFKCIILSALIITILPFFNSNFTYYNFNNVFHNTNHYAYYLMINIMLTAFMFIDNKNIFKKIIYSLIYIFFLYLIVINDTFGCYLAITVSLIFMFIYSLVKKYKRLDIILLILLFAITSFFVSHYDIRLGEKITIDSEKQTISQNMVTFSNDIKSFITGDNRSNKAGHGRGYLWKEAINYTLDHPIIGGGMECLNDYYKNNVKYNDRPHNIILQISSFIGIPGAIIYIALILYIAITNLKIMNHDTIHIMVYVTAMCYFISSIFGNSMYYTSPYFMILLGLLVGFNRHKNKKID